MAYKNVLYNILGLGIPFFAAFFSIPYLITNLGNSLFGVLTLIWAIVSYFSLFDFGLGRSLTLELSISLAKNELNRISSLVYTSLVSLAILGFFAGILMLFFIPIANLKDSIDISVVEIKWCILVMALAMPSITLTSGLRGILESKGAFKIINIIRLPMGLFTFLGPVASIMLFGNSLIAISIVLVFGRFLAMLVHFYFVIKMFKKDNTEILKGEFKKSELKCLIYSGGWMTVSNIVSPLMTYLDRFFIGSFLSTSAVTYYVTPQELLSKISIIPIAITSVLFPAVSGNIGNNNVNKKIYRDTTFLLLILILPLLSILFFFSFEILKFWISEGFALNSHVTMKIICIGMFFTCLAQVPFTLIQGHGCVKFTALVHIIELPVYCLAMYMLGINFGLEGIALAWCLRNFIDYLIMLSKSHQILKS